MNNGAVFIVDDDIEDKELLKEAWGELGFNNTLRFFGNGQEVLEYLQTQKEVPFLIISDFYLPKLNGLELKKKLLEDENTHYKSIPFVFLCSAASVSQISKAYDVCTNGFFLKEDTFEGLKQQLVDIVRYWLKSLVPIN